MKHKKTNILLGIVAAGYLSIALANIGLNGMIDGHGNPEQAKGMAWGVKMYPISTVLIFICRTEQYCETFLVRDLYGAEAGIWEERQSLIYFPKG